MRAEAMAAAAVAVVLFSAFCTRAVRDFARRRGLLDLPNHRSSHVLPTPRTGGVAIVLAAITGWLSYGLLFGLTETDVVVLIGAVFTAVVGLLDDLVTLRPTPKFVGQVLVAIPAVWLLPAAVPTWPTWISVLISVFWIVGYTNALNFMDGSDGLAAGHAVVIMLTIAAFSAAAQQPGLTWFAVAVSASALGFLGLNRSPASIFMGDAGSFFLGFCIAAAAIRLTAAGISVVALALLLSPFLVDTSFTLWRRLLRGERVWLAHREHLYQRLLLIGRSHKHVAHRYYVWQLVAAAAAWAVQYGTRPVQAMAIFVGVAFAVGVVVAVGRAERTDILGKARTGPSLH